MEWRYLSFENSEFIKELNSRDTYGTCQKWQVSIFILRWQVKKHLSIIKNAQKQGLKSMKNKFKIVEKLQKTRENTKK